MKKLLVLMIVLFPVLAQAGAHDNPAVFFGEKKLNELVPIEICTFIKKLESSVESGTGEIQFCAGFMHMQDKNVMTGDNLPQDFVEAYIWFSLAALMPNNKEQDLSLSWRDNAAKRHSVEEIRDAQREVRRRWDQIQRRNQRVSDPKWNDDI